MLPSVRARIGHQVGVVAGLVASIAFVAGAPRPDVKVVVTDDQGYGGLSPHNNPVRMSPSMNALHSEPLLIVGWLTYRSRLAKLIASFRREHD